MYDAAIGHLIGSGYERYEVSTFAKPGHRSVHNQLYWTDRPYVGVGPGAHGYGLSGRRWRNPELSEWLVRPFAAGQRPTPEEAAIDLLVGGLRFIDGLSVAHLERATGLSPRRDVVQALVDAGVIVDSADRLQITEAGMPIADGVVARLADALQVAIPPS